MRKLVSFIALLSLLVGCNESSDGVGGESQGSGDVTLQVGIDYGIEVISRASTTIDGDYSIVITDQGDEIISQGVYSDYSETFFMTAYSGYKITAESITEAEALEGRGVLRYYGSTEFDVTVGDRTDVVFECSVANARVSIDYTDDFKTMFSAAEVSVWESDDAERIMTYDYDSSVDAESYWAYFNIDETPAVNIKVNATLNSGVEKEYSTTISIAKATWNKVSVHSTVVGGEAGLSILVDDDITISESSLGVTPLQELEITLPAQDETNVWATFFYPTAASLDNISDVDNRDIILQNLTYEVSSDGENWTASTTSNGTRIFDGLTPNTTYTLRTRYYNVVSSNTQSFTTESDSQVGNAGFEDWSTGTITHEPTVFKSYSRTIYYPYLTTTGYDKWWDTNNAQTMSEMSTTSSANYKFFPAVSYITGRSGSYAAQVCALAYGGSFTTSTTTSGTKVPGRLLIGSINSSGSITSTGHSFTSRPLSLDFWYYCDIYNDTGFVVYVELLSGTTTIATGTMTQGSDVSSWTQATVNLNYTNTNLKATSIYIKIQSTTSESPDVRTENITISDGTFEIWKGSVVVVDDLTLNY